MPLPSYEDAAAYQAPANATNRLTQDVSNLAPLATTYHTPVPTQYGSADFNAPKPSGGIIGNFAHFLGGVGSEVGHIAGGAATWLAKNTVQMAEAPFKFTYDFTKGAINTYEQNNQVNDLLAKQQNLSKQWRAGQITNEQFQGGLKDILGQQKTLSDNISSTQQMLQNSKLEGINTAATLVTLATAGIAGIAEPEVLTASKYLTSVNANAFLGNVESGVAKLAASPELFAKLSPMAQKAIQTATADVVSTATNATASQIARSTAINLALKYPIYYNYLSSTGTQIYHELDQKKYGAAVRTTAFNAALLLSGGPIGYALKYLGKGVGTLVGGAFGKSSFIDELSKSIGNGDPGGLYNAIIKLPEADRADVVKQLSAVETTNMAATGKDVVAAAIRVIKGMESYEGISMSQFTHEEALNNMVNFAKAQRIADEAGKAAGLGPVTVGRVDARALNEISAGVSQGIDSESRLRAWDNLKAQNPTQAWANNENFDRQVKALIEKHQGTAELDNAIKSIKASFQLDGIPKSVAKQLSAMGYIPIKPVDLQAPFTEGTGKLASKFANDDNFFLKAVQPLPVLGWLGGALTKFGLSPNASTARVYQIFNDNLARNLQETGVVPKIMGEDSAQTTDDIIKKLSNYAHNPTRGKLNKLPITDLRMMTTKDVQAALDITASEARNVQKAISSSFLQVPIEVRGLGDRAVDLSYKAAGPIQRRYLRLQGAARFSFNPFFQYLRVVPKTETLASFEGGGFVSSVFSGQGKLLGQIRNDLRAGGFLEKSGFTSSSDIASEAVGFGEKNLTRKLLPMQERSIAGLINSQAERMGMDYKTYITQNPQQVRDTIQMIAEYDRRSNFLNSPLARTLNIAFFPFRFDTKVAMIMTRNLAKTSLMTQVSVVNGMLRAHNWLNSDEGKAWYAQNSEAIGLFKYVTPVASLNEVFHSLMPGNDHSLGNFGELGGLPFGWIPQILDAEGLTHFNQPGANPKTGALYTKYIPVSQRGQVATAIQDFLGTLFSYPGATVGLYSKTKITSGLANSFVGATSSDFKKVTPNMSSEQQAYMQSLGLLPQSTPQPSPPVPETQKVPVLGSPNVQINPKKVSVPKKKKADYRPQLLPGQSTLGQL